ncbi:hypothetical protein CYMTET_13359 [Cymbomonas tetramitiformis]|uniref:J domain-containing protein n=1 Tax=Cymbomonas tetramitiformis TaxID=36881 RepID=A0AAE0GIK9_9CHLO|nr:hypothetical protein CYMTET_13359 [Cymbomonas tetramitiformis]
MRGSNNLSLILRTSRAILASDVLRQRVHSVPPRLTQAARVDVLVSRATHATPFLSAAHDFYRSYCDRTGTGGVNACWSCGSRRDVSTHFFCASCGVILPPSPESNYFEVLNMPPIYDVDQDDISTKLRTLQLQLHPDRFSSKSKEEQGMAENQSALVNEAVAVLRSPLRRAQYMLQGAGIEVGEGHEGTIEDPELLMEVMEQRMAIEEADGDEELRPMRQHNLQQLEESRKQVSAAFADGNVQEAAHETIRMQYLVKISDTILDKLSST